jgi:hypothetical protein
MTRIKRRPAMLSRAWLSALFVFLAAQANAADDAWIVHGQVLDSQGKPAPGVDVAVFWNCNGIPLTEIRRIEKEQAQGHKPDTTKLDAVEGPMEPWGLAPTKTDADGRFASRMTRSQYYLVAIDKQRQRGGLILSRPTDASSTVTIKLGPLVRMHGRLRVAGTNRPPDHSVVVARIPDSEEFPLGNNRVAVCWSRNGTFDISLPPGKYELEGNGDLDDRRNDLAPNRPVVLPSGKSDVDAGVFELTPHQPRRWDRIEEAKAKGTWPNIDPKQLYGQPAPKWHAVDTRGIPRDAQVSDFKGKWVLVYFWGPWCNPCLGREIPALTKFYDVHAAERDRFEIVSICSTEPEIKTLADLDRELKPVVKAIWHGKQIPFPIVLDNTLESNANFGQTASKLLFNPEGRLVPGDEKTLAEKLKQ